MATNWDERIRPDTNWGMRTKPDTSWGTRTQPTTNWGARGEVDTDWSGRTKPMTYMTPLQDGYTMVADEEDRIIYILADSGTLIPATFWKTRPVI